VRAARETTEPAGAPRLVSDRTAGETDPRTRTDLRHSLAISSFPTVPVWTGIGRSGLAGTSKENLPREPDTLADLVMGLAKKVPIGRGGLLMTLILAATIPAWRCSDT
jgi:hypothetical protein